MFRSRSSLQFVPRLRALLPMALVALLLTPATLTAQQAKNPQEAERPGELSQQLETIDTKQGLLIRKPDGWVAATPAKGTVAILRAAGDDTSRIEFRVAPEMDAEKAALYFTSFHANLQTAGLKKLGESQAKTYGENAGTQTEYETASSKKKYRLLVWQTHQGDKAWLVVAFLEDQVRDAYLDDYAELITNLAFK